MVIKKQQTKTFHFYFFEILNILEHAGRVEGQYDQGQHTIKHPLEIIQLQTSDHYNHGQSTFFLKLLY